MAVENSKILTAEQEMKLRQPIEDYVGKIQEKIDSLRADGTDKVLSLQNDMDVVKKDRIFTKEEKDAKIAQLKAELEKAKAVEAKNKDEISKLIADAEAYLRSILSRITISMWWRAVSWKRFRLRKSTAGM